VISKKLKTEEIISSRFGFSVTAILTARFRKIRTGVFAFRSGMSNVQVLDELIRESSISLRKVIIFDGSSLDDIGSRLEQEGVLSKESFVAYTQSQKEAFTALTDDTLRGRLLPGKYFFFNNALPADVISTMHTAFTKFFKDEVESSLEQSGMNLNQVLTLASIVQWETNKREEMPLIAGVYFNRLKKGMKLQACPTILYLRNERRGRITYEQLQIKSPFNTYLNEGLPPAPINNPGKDAILAVLHPQVTKYLYFVADAKGGHQFSVTYSEHRRNSKRYLKWINRQN
jgi:UPF0755 protein